MSTTKVVVENVLRPGTSHRVDATKYEAMRGAVLKALPRGGPALTSAELIVAVRPHVPAEPFPGGAKAGWWLKAVQLDLEAKGAIAREHTKPLRWRRA